MQLHVAAGHFHKETNISGASFTYIAFFCSCFYLGVLLIRFLAIFQLYLKPTTL